MSDKELPLLTAKQVQIVLRTKVDDLGFAKFVVHWRDKLSTQRQAEYHDNLQWHIHYWECRGRVVNVQPYTAKRKGKTC